MSAPSSCPRCGGSMEPGFLLDEAHGSRKPSKWIEGVPEYRMWNLKLRGKRQLEVVSYRCRSCGHLESYAPE